MTSHCHFTSFPWNSAAFFSNFPLASHCLHETDAGTQFLSFPRGSSGSMRRRDCCDRSCNSCSCNSGSKQKRPRRWIGGSSRPRRRREEQPLPKQGCVELCLPVLACACACGWQGRIGVRCFDDCHSAAASPPPPSPSPPSKWLQQALAFSLTSYCHFTRFPWNNSTFPLTSHCLTETDVGTKRLISVPPMRQYARTTSMARSMEMTCTRLLPG